MPQALIVDDDAATREAMLERLEQDSFRVSSCDSLASAWGELETKTFDLVLLDVQLPDGNGLALLNDLEQQPGAEIVFITGHGSVD
jgi:DNA-binding NtrC family response regulator